MRRDQKAQVIDEIATQIAESEAIYAADYRGLSVSQAAALRGKLREADATFRIVKNTLTLRAAEKADAEQVKELIEGPTAFTFVRGDPALAAKALDAFARQEQVPTIRGGLIGTELLSSEAFRQLARLPGRDQLNAQLAGVVASPLTGLVRGLGSLLSGLAVALSQVQEKKVAEAPAEAQVEEALDAPAEETVEAPAEETVEAPAEETVEAPAEEQPAAQEQPPADEAPAEPQASEDGAVDEAPAEPQASDEEPAAEQASAAEAEPAAEQPETSEESESAGEPAEDKKEAE